MSFFSKIISDYKELSWSKRTFIIFLVAGILCIYTPVIDLYFNQDNACEVLREFVRIPLPNESNVTIYSLHNSKIVLFSIICEIKDSEKTNEKIIKEFLLENNYKNSGDEYTKNKVRINIKGSNELCLIEISTIEK